MARWDKKGIPHKGWHHLGVEDLGEGVSGYEPIPYEQCEMCGNERIRYVHILKHPDYPYELRVGCDCAEKLIEGHADLRQKERDVRNRSSRKVTFLKREWTQNWKTGNYVLRYKNEYITIMNSTYDDGFGVIYRGHSVWRYKGKKIYDFETAKLAAFDLYEDLNQ